MSTRIKVLIVTLFFLMGSTVVNAQATDYLLHGKTFSYCSFKKVCSGCRSCEDTRYQVEIRNKQDKKIKSIHYKVYSSLYNHTETKEAQIEGDIINSHDGAFVYICVPDIRQWFISEIIYDDNTSSTFEIKGRLESFLPGNRRM